MYMRRRYINIVLICMMISSMFLISVRGNDAVDDISSEDEIIEWGNDDSNNNYTYLENKTQVLIREPGREEEVKGEVQIIGDVIGVNITQVKLYIDEKIINTFNLLCGSKNISKISHNK